MARKALDDFRFESIGQQPSLLSRFSNAEDAAVQPILSTSPSPSPSPRASALPLQSSSSRLLEALVPTIMLTQHGLNNDQPPASNPHPEGGSVCRGKVSPHLRQVAEPITAGERPMMTATVPSHIPSLPFSSQLTSHPSAPLPSLTAANVSSAPLGTGPSNLLGLGVVLPASISPSLPQGDDAIEIFRQTLKRLQTEANEFGRREEETRRAAARQQDQAARWHARADAVIDNMRDLFAMAEQRIASAEQRAAHSETKVAQREEELRELRVALARAEQENATLRRESEEERQRAAEQRTAEDAHVTEVLAKAGDAVKQAESRERERQIEEAHLRKIVEEERSRREALERELGELQQQVELDKRALQMELEESKRTAEQEQQRRMDELVEEKRRLEERLAKATAYQTAAKTGIRDVPSSQETQESTPQHSSASAPPIITSVQVTAESTSPTHSTASHTASRKNLRGKGLHLSTEVAFHHTSAASDGLAQPPASATMARTNSSQMSPPDQKLLGALDDIEPLPPVKDEESDGLVKSELSSPTISSHEQHADDGEARKLRREQSLEYANLSQGTVPMITSLKTGSRIPSNSTTEAASSSNMTGRLTIPCPPSPPIQHRGCSPETLYASGVLQSSVSQHGSLVTAGHTYQAVDLERSPALQMTHSSSFLPPHREPPPYEHDSRDLDERSRPISPPPNKQPRPMRQRGDDRPQHPFVSRHFDHYSPSPPPPGLDHWSPSPYQPYNRDDRYSPQVRHKRTRGNDDAPDSPDAHRPRLDPTTYDSHPPGPSLAQQMVPMADDSHSYYDHRRDQSPHRRSPRSLSPDARRGYPLYPAHAPNRYAPPPQDRARTPPYPPDHAVNGYAAPEAPTLVHETEAPSSHMAASTALSPSGSAHAPTPAKVADQSKSTHIPKTTTTAARKPPHKQLPPPTVDAGKRLLIDRIGEFDAAAGAGRNGGAAKHTPLVSKHAATRSANTHTRGGKKGPRGPARTYQEDTRAQSGGSAQSRSLAARIQTSSLQERLS